MAEAMASKVHGTNRVIAKIENSIRNGNYYEAHQLYKTLYFRYLGQKKYVELLDLLYDGAVLLLERDQHTSGADIGILYIDTLVKSETEPVIEYLNKVGKIFSLISQDTPDRETYLNAAVRWSNNSPQLHQYVALTYWHEKEYGLARRHFMRCYDGSNFGAMLIELHKSSGYSSEVDLFIAQVVLQCLCLKNKRMAVVTFQCYTSQHPSITKGPPYLLPLLNFIWFLLEVVDGGRLTQFTILCQQYQLSINRDPTYVHYLDKIGQLFFNVPAPGRSAGSALFGDLFHSLVRSMNDDDDDPDEPPPSSSRSSGPSAHVMETELD